MNGRRSLIDAEILALGSRGETLDTIRAATGAPMSRIQEVLGKEDTIDAIETTLGKEYQARALEWLAQLLDVLEGFTAVRDLHDRAYKAALTERDRPGAKPDWPGRPGLQDGNGRPLRLDQIVADVVNAIGGGRQGEWGSAASEILEQRRRESA